MKIGILFYFEDFIDLPNAHVIMTVKNFTASVETRNILNEIFLLAALIVTVFIV